MSYESDPSGQPLPGDSDSHNHGGQIPQEGQNHWLLDGEQASPISQPVHAEPASPTGGENWLLDGEEAVDPSIIVTEDSDGDSWLMNVGEPTVALEEDDAVDGHSFSASYCEPKSTASTFSKLLIPTVFVGVLGVGGMLVWRSMSGLGSGTDGSNGGAVVNDIELADQGEPLSGPSFEVSESSMSSGGSPLRGSIQRDGSVKQATPGFTANAVKGQFGFTPSSDNSTDLVSEVEPDLASEVEPDLASEVEPDLASEVEPEVEEIAADDVSEGAVAESQQPELPLSGPGTPVEPAIALEFEALNADQESSEPQVTTDKLLSEEQEGLLAQADADDSVELVFLFEDPIETPAPMAEVLESEVMDPSAMAEVLESEAVDPSPLAEENTALVEEPSGALAAAEGEEFVPLGRKFVDELLAMGPAPGFEEAPDGVDGFELGPVENWFDGEAQVSPELLPPTLEESSDLATVVDDIPEGLPMSIGFDGQGDWLMGDTDQPSEVAVADTASEDPVLQELFSVPDIESTNAPSGDVPVALVRAEEPVVNDSVPADSRVGTMSSIDPNLLGNPFFELVNIGIVPEQEPVVINWEDPLADVQGEPVESELVAASEPIDGPDETLLVDSQTPETSDLTVEQTGPELEDSRLVDSVELDDIDEVPAGESEAEVTAEGLASTVDVVSEDVTEDTPTLDVQETAPAPLAQVSVEDPAPDQSVPESEPSDSPTAVVIPEAETQAPKEPDASQAAAIVELMSVPSEGEVASGTETSEPTTASAGKASEGNGERSLLEMYSDWNMAEDKGTLQSQSSSKWLNFSIGDRTTMPFQIAQSSIAGQREELTKQPEEVVVEAEVKKPHQGVLRKRQVDSSHWQGKDVPMHALSRSTVLLTPNVGPVRVIAVDGETLEGRLHGIGQNYVWLVTNLGRLSIPSRRVQRVEPIDPAQFVTEVKSTQDYTKLPRVRVRMKGGVFVGHELAREGNRITIRTDKGHKLTLVSDDIQRVRTRRAKSGIKRRVE